MKNTSPFIPARLVFNNNAEKASYTPSANKGSFKPTTSMDQPDAAKKKAEEMMTAGIGVPNAPEAEKVNVGKILGTFNGKLSSMIENDTDPDTIKTNLTAYYSSLSPDEQKALWNNHIYRAKPIEPTYLTKWSIITYHVSFPRSGGISIDIQQKERQRNDYYLRIPKKSKTYPGHTEDYEYEYRKGLSPSEEEAYNAGIVEADKEAQRIRSKAEIIGMMNAGVKDTLENYKQGGFHDDADLRDMLQRGTQVFLDTLTPGEKAHLDGYSKSGTVKEPWPYSDTDWSLVITNGKAIATAD